MVNPASLMKLKGLYEKFETSHPKMVTFFKVAFGSDILEGTVIEISVKKPGEEPIVGNMRITADDLELVEQLKEIAK